MATTPEPSAVPVLERCHCGHTEDQHDAVAARYCRATLAGVLRRRCTCPVDPPESAPSYDRR